MNYATILGSASRTWIAVALVSLVGLSSGGGWAQDSPPADAHQAENKSTAKTERPGGRWRAFGRVTDHGGRPLVGVEVSARCGMGTLKKTGVASSGEDGRYELNLGLRGLSARGNATATEVASIFAHKSGYFEVNLNRQGNCVAANRMFGDEEIRIWGNRTGRVFLPDRPLELNFVMRPAGRVAGKVTDEQGHPLVGYSVALTGVDRPPSSGVMCWAQVDEHGRFSLDDIPTTYRFQFEIRKSNPMPPWDDSWASAALRFERPDEGDMRAWFGDREIRLRELGVRVAGPGVHGKIATSMDGDAGMLNLTARDPADVLQRSDKLLVAKSAVLTLRNSPPKDSSQSLIAELVSVEWAYASNTRLARTPPTESGEFMISFPNPRDCELEPGKQRVIFQLFVGASENPIRERIVRQLEIRRDGRYQVPVKIRPEWIDDSQVSIAFVSIKPDHEAWVQALVHDGIRTHSSRIWRRDVCLLSAIPFEIRSGKQH
jgi:hypothetical protein